MDKSYIVITFTNSLPFFQCTEDSKERDKGYSLGFDPTMFTGLRGVRGL